MFQVSKWQMVLGLRVQPNAFNEEAWHYKFNGKEMSLAAYVGPLNLDRTKYGKSIQAY